MLPKCRLRVAYFHLCVAYVLPRCLLIVCLNDCCPRVCLKRASALPTCCPNVCLVVAHVLPSCGLARAPKLVVLVVAYALPNVCPKCHPAFAHSSPKCCLVFPMHTHGAYVLPSLCRMLAERVPGVCLGCAYLFAECVPTRCLIAAYGVAYDSPTICLTLAWRLDCVSA